jgi:hypothetical protein
MPISMLVNWRNASTIVVDQAGDLTCRDPAADEKCGISGTLPTRLPGLPNPYTRFSIVNSRSTGRLTFDLLSWGREIQLSNNQLTGPVPGATYGCKAQRVDLSNNKLEVSTDSIRGCSQHARSWCEAGQVCQLQRAPGEGSAILLQKTSTSERLHIASGLLIVACVYSTILS